MHPFVASVLLGMPRRDAFEVNPQAEPPDRQFAEAVDRVRRGKRHPVVGADGARQPELLEGALEDGEREFLLRRRECLAGLRARVAIEGYAFFRQIRALTQTRETATPKR
jgi:hypothetical protein